LLKHLDVPAERVIKAIKKLQQKGVIVVKDLRELGAGIVITLNHKHRPGHVKFNKGGERKHERFHDHYGHEKEQFHGVEDSGKRAEIQSLWLEKKHGQKGTRHPRKHHFGQHRGHGNGKIKILHIAFQDV